MMRDAGSLEAHGVRWRFNFLEAVPDVDWTPEPQWAEADLTSAHLAELDGWVDEHVAERPQDSRELARYYNLEHNGVQHAHLRGEFLYPKRPAYGYKCRLCEAYIINKNPIDSLFIGGPADGRWMVTDGGPYWRVPIIQPITIAAGDGGWMPEVATYRRVGDRYVFEG